MESFSTVRRTPLEWGKKSWSATSGNRTQVFRTTTGGTNHYTKTAEIKGKYCSI